MKRKRRPLWRVRLYGPAGVVAEWVVLHRSEFVNAAGTEIRFMTDRGEVMVLPGAAHSVVWEAVA